MSDRINVERLRQIEAQLTDDTLTDDDLVAALVDAGLPELARVVTRFTRSARPRRVAEPGRPHLHVVDDDAPR
ncbi:hypothetical protein C8D87_11444 [Lentzea atacamensis]|uniref:Uncharacterized protein n=1 Tax=Lentzea atacamensis TaxID=531938 RepID=A0ABX9DYZ3_9PSEU|nr:hypothetical protein [Lentzea atacamensis]RAS59432.1 hypothetical protein C8D87_11444 [Lentzea atacamensis]